MLGLLAGVFERFVIRDIDGPVILAGVARGSTRRDGGLCLTVMDRQRCASMSSCGCLMRHRMMMTVMLQTGTTFDPLS